MQSDSTWEIFSRLLWFCRCGNRPFAMNLPQKSKNQWHQKITKKFSHGDGSGSSYAYVDDSADMSTDDSTLSNAISAVIVETYDGKFCLKISIL